MKMPSAGMLVLKMGVIDPDIQGHFGHFDSKFQEIWLVCMGTSNGFELKYPNRHLVTTAFSQKFINLVIFLVTLS